LTEPDVKRGPRQSAERPGQQAIQASVALRPYENADFGLTVSLESDPVVMRELGGPIDRASLPEIHRRRLEDPWWFKITIEPPGQAVGAIGIWEKELDGASVWETGWMVLPSFQSRGIASAALDLLIRRAQDEPSLKSIHAFPPVTNEPSNALCRKFKFSLVGQREVVYASRTLRCNHWRLATPSRQKPADK
jgi:RimJ/RimL family protein N-acetyltransferase